MLKKKYLVHFIPAVIGFFWKLLFLLCQFSLLLYLPWFQSSTCFCLLAFWALFWFWSLPLPFWTLFTCAGLFMALTYTCLMTCEFYFWVTKCCAEPALPGAAVSGVPRLVFVVFLAHKPWQLLYKKYISTKSQQQMKAKELCSNEVICRLHCKYSPSVTNHTSTLHVGHIKISRFCKAISKGQIFSFQCQSFKILKDKFKFLSSQQALLAFLTVQELLLN